MKSPFFFLLAFVASMAVSFSQQDFKRRTADEGTPGHNVLRLASAMADTETVTVNGVVWEASYDGVVAAGRIEIDLSAAGTKSSRILTATANPTATETITIGATVYTFRASVATTAYEVLIGATAEATYNNLVAAITAGAGSGTTYGSATVAHPSVTATEGTDVAATTILTLTENAADTNTVTIGATVYTFQDTLTNVAGNVKIGASASATIDNLIAAITVGSGSGTLYAAATVVHPSVTAAVGAGDTMGVTALTVGAAGNLIASTDTLAGTSAFTSTVLAGGSDKVLATALVTGTAGDSIATTETCAAASWASATLTGGAQATAEQGTDAFVAATNAAVSAPINAVKIGANEVFCYTRILNKNWASTETLAGSNNVWAAAAFFGQSVGRVIDPPVTAVKRLATATEVTLETMHFMFAFEPSGAIIQVRNTDGTLKAVDGAMTISGRRVSWASSGSTDIDADDIVTVVAF